ncbi:MAG: LCP family protein, partial [Anaerolineae bacterium]
MRRLLHALLSFLVPGVGQIVGGARRRGIILLGVVLAVLVVLVVMSFLGWDYVLAWVIQPQVLLGLLIANVIFLAFRLYAILDAYLAGRPRKPLGHPPTAEARRPAASPTVPLVPPPGVSASQPTPISPDRGSASGPRQGSAWRAVLAGVGLAILLLLTVAPHVVAGYYAYLSRDLLTTVFVDEEITVTTTTTTPAPTTSTIADSTLSTLTTGSTTTTTEVTTTTADPSLDWGGDNRLTVLLIGTDAGWGRRGARADSVNVATLDLETGSVALFGIPRNTGSLPLNDEVAKALGTHVWIDMISNLYEAAQDHAELAPEGGDPGAEVLKDVVSGLLGIPIHHYAVVNMGGLVDLVDALGGIKINVKTRVWVRLSPPTPDDDWKVYDIQPGIQELDGHGALAFARSRTGNSDYDRMRRQRCVLMALLYQKGVTLKTSPVKRTLS